ncbi:hypothetical protein D3C72_780030 [compost metagenome]
MVGRHRGFTLIEILVAATLIGVVMAMAMQAFMGMGRLSDVAKSRMVASTEANKGVREVAALLRRAHVIYFTGRPFQAGAGVIRMNTDADLAARPGTNRDYSNDPVTDRIPDVLGANGPLPGPMLRYNFTDPTEPIIGGSPLSNVRRGAFRFYDWGAGANANTLLGPQRLRSREPNPPGAEATELDFTSPLLYIGEIDFAQDRTGFGPGGATDGAITNMFLPLSWTFHVVYLAPMAIPANPTTADLPSWTTTRRPSDLAPGGWRRSTIPFELRVFTIPNVDSTREGDRFIAQRNGLGNHVKGAPFDYVENTINYDPIPILSGGNAGDFLNPAGTTKYRYRNPPPNGPLATANASGARVNGGMHTNFNNIGNDPPSQAALLIRTQDSENNDRRITDRVLAQYVDPDSVHGTCVRLLNTIGASQGELLTREDNANQNAALYRRYINAYGGEFLYNHYRALLTNPASWDNRRGAPIPQRALISVATRYRTSSQVKFQFATESIELDLENLVRYQNLSRRSR